MNERNFENFLHSLQPSSSSSATNDDRDDVDEFETLLMFICLFNFIGSHASDAHIYMYIDWRETAETFPLTFSLSLHEIYVSMI